MKAWAAAGLAAAAALSAITAGAATVSVTITGQADTVYELDVSGIQKTGRIGRSPEGATVRSLIQVEGREMVTAKLTFTAPGGRVASCSAVKVRLAGAQAACDPAFVLKRGGVGSACESRCEPRKSTRAPSADEEEDPDEWVYALRSPSAGASGLRNPFTAAPSR